MSSFIIADSDSEKNIPVGSKNLILVRSASFLDGRPYQEPHFSIVTGRYLGDGKWAEIEYDETQSAFNAEEKIISDPLVSCTGNPEMEAVPDFFGYGRDDDFKRGLDVVAYYPYPYLPDLSKIEPMKI